MLTSNTTRKTVLLRSNFLPGPSSESFDWIERNLDKNETNSSSYSYSLPTTNLDLSNDLFMFGLNQTVFESFSLEDAPVNSSTFVYSIVLGIILFTITIWTILGNILVILAFVTNKQIRQGGMSNYLIINLAISDLLLGIAVLPFSASYSTFGLWYFGKFLCEFWLAIDVLCSTASIWVRRRRKEKKLNNFFDQN